MGLAVVELAAPNKEVLLKCLWMRAWRIRTRDMLRWKSSRRHRPRARSAARFVPIHAEIALLAWRPDSRLVHPSEAVVVLLNREDFASVLLDTAVALPD